MIRHQGYQFRLKPTLKETELLRKFIGCSRFIWNEMIIVNKLRNECGEKRLSYAAMCKYLRHMKDEYPFLREVHSQPLQQTLKDLATAYQRAYNPKLTARLPHLKRRNQTQGIRFPQDFKINNNAIYLPKIGWISFYKSKKIEGTLKNVNISWSGQHWYLSVQTEREETEVIHQNPNSGVGVDLGIKKFAALSDGTFVEGINAFQKYQKPLAFLQRRLSKKVKFSKNWRKEKNKIFVLHRKISNIRKDMLHKASTTICKNHAIVVMEDLRIANMTKSVRGTIENPAKNVNAKSGLNRRILDQSWGEFRRQLDYKLRWNGGHLILVNPENTSLMCNICSYVSKDNRVTQAAFKCVSCGHFANADTNAAKNILQRAGQARIACGVSKDTAKQEALCVA